MFYKTVFHQDKPEWGLVTAEHLTAYQVAALMTTFSQLGIVGKFETAEEPEPEGVKVDMSEVPNDE